MDAWNEVEIQLMTPSKADGIGFTKLQIWCNEAKVVDFVENAGCETVWLANPDGSDGSDSPCFKTTGHSLFATYNAPKFGEKRFNFGRIW